MFRIESESTESMARTGILNTAHGVVKTPIFMPVGTLGTVKSLTPEDLTGCGAQIILSNTYHLFLRPGCNVIDLFSGLHDFMHWNKPILTDSGGFQVFSLAKLAKITDEGYAFQSHIDGSRHLMTPEKSVETQVCLNSDIIMCLDQCIKYPCTHEQTGDAVDLTVKWAKRCRYRLEKESDPKNLLFGIVQGGMFKDLREKSAEETTRIGFSGYAVGGLSVGEPKDIMLEIAHFTLGKLPSTSPKYVMGVGTPEDLVQLVGMGADMFDCVMPTRNARNGQLFTVSGTMNICNSRFKNDIRPIQQGCGCYTCQHYSRAYLRHLYMTKELLAYRLNTIHNIYYYLNLMNQIRVAIRADKFQSFKKNFYAKRMKNAS
jgi:queuine tRNA-ribosyltransferase